MVVECVLLVCVESEEGCSSSCDSMDGLCCCGCGLKSE